MLTSSSQNKGIHVNYSTPANKDPPEEKTMAIIAVMRGKPKGGYHCHHSNKHYVNRGSTCKSNTTTEHNPPEADNCHGRSNGKPKNGYHRSNKYYL